MVAANALNKEISSLDHICNLNFSMSASHYCLTGIIGTISKSSRSFEIMKKMIMGGMNIVRLNFSHETQEIHAETIRLLRNVESMCSKELGYSIQVAIALDTKGPEIRTGFLESGSNAQIELKAYDSIRLSINRDLMDKGNRECIYVDYDNIINLLQPGHVVYINDGSLKLIVREVGVDCITCQVERGGMLGSRKKVNLPGVIIDLPPISTKDACDLKFAVENEVDIILASSIRNAAAVNEIRLLLGERGKSIKIIAKIDCEQGLNNVDEIISVADGILFASADIAIEIDYSKVFLAQKAVVARCNRSGKPIILGTKLFESMRYSNIPTKAEVFDLGNAILDGVDCVMLSSETAIGTFPFESIAHMSITCREAELALWHKHIFEDLLLTNPPILDAAHSVAIAAVDAANRTKASAIIVLTVSGRSSHLLSKYRPRCPILAITKCATTFRQSHLYRGVIPIIYTGIPNKSWLKETDDRIKFAMNDVDVRVQFGLQVGKNNGFIKSGDQVVIVTGWKQGAGFTNTMRIVMVAANALNKEISSLDHICNLNFSMSASHYCLTGIIGTISKSSRSFEIMKKMIMGGMNIVRLNFSHETQEIHAETIRLLRNVESMCSKELGYSIQVAIALDTKGPEIRTGFLESGSNAQIELKAYDSIRLSINRDLMDKGNRECIYVDYDNIINLLQPGHVVYINDGSLKLIVREVGVDCITCQVERGGMLGSRKKVNLPGVIIDLPPISTKDACDLKFAVENEVDIILASSIRNAAAVNEIRLLLGERGKSIKIIAKIDCEQGLNNVDEIISVADGILFASADIAIEIDYSKVFLAQKAVVARCNRSGKPIILGTKLFESMRYSNIPTKAEVFDLGNAILDGVDCVMLSSETAIGTFPFESIAHMSITCREAELALWHKHIFEDLLLTNPPILDAAHSVAIAAVDAANRTKASAIIVLTVSGRSSHLLSKYRPRCPILAITKCATTFRQSHLYRGVIPIIYTGIPNKSWLKETDDRIKFAMNVGKLMKIIVNGDPVVILSPWMDGGGFTNTMRLVYAFYEIEDFDCI
ncbi:uncharacterized protein ACRADG_013165 [Cochliomyia hominivorax]